MSASIDTLTVLPFCALFLHLLILLGMGLHTALAPDSPHDQGGDNRTLKALILGRAPIQRTGRNTLNARLLAISGLLLAAASIMSLVKSAAPAWTAVLTGLTLAQLASAYAWDRPARVNTAGGAEQEQSEDSAAEDDAEANCEETPREPGAN
ncbi:hypothetical protein OG613_48850 (plasmid) [Streptomyces sp. NBC_00015]|uniref:hypothetical protein n=1 Tax=Streptomyces sp. NBC_00015 TaxID=2903611 RepID=UPI002F9151D1